MTETTSLPTPYDLLGGEPIVRQLVASFYAHMADDEPVLARMHELEDDGRVSARTQARFGDFLVEWLGGPQLFSAHSGHPRLRMRHAHVPVDEAMRDAWLRAMQSALDDIEARGEVRSFLNQRLADVANFLRNVAGSES